MRKHYFLSSLVIFVAGFALSAILDVRHLATTARGAVSDSAAPEVAEQIAPQPSTSQKWQYRMVTTFNHRNDQGSIDFELNRLGEQGYEVCGVAQSSGDVGAPVLSIVLRRPK
jgi:hypothetical protein